MSKPIDYSRFDRIELSDDEDTFHPNLDKNLNQRVNRISRDRKEEEIDAEKKRLEEAGQLEQAAKVEARTPLHVGNIGRVTEDRTIINFSQGRSDRYQQDCDELWIDGYMEFKAENKQLLDEFTHADWDTSRQMLVQRGDILLDECANNYFGLSTLEAQMKGDAALVQKLGRQGQIISQIHQLAKAWNRPPRDFVHRFFERFACGEGQAVFQHGLDHFLEGIVRRAEEKKREAAQEAAEAEAADVEMEPDED